MSDTYEIKKDVPVPSSDKRTGLTKTIRKMEYLDSIVIPADKISSVHPCAAQAGAKVKTQKNPDGTVTVWRVNPPAAAPGPAASTSTPAAAAAASETKSTGGYYDRQRPYGPSVFVATELNTHGQPIVPEPTTKKDIFS